MYKHERYLRVAAGLIQKSIAEEAGVSITTVHHYEVGSNNIRPLTEKKVKEAYYELIRPESSAYCKIKLLALAMQLREEGNRRKKKEIKNRITELLDLI